MKTPLLSPSSFRWALAAALVTAYFGSPAVVWAHDDVGAPPTQSGEAPSSAPPATPGPEGVGPEAAPGTGQLAQPPSKDEPTKEDLDDQKKKKPKNPFRGSTLIFDQSMSTQTAHLEPAAQLSYVPSYQWWISFRPRYNFNDQLSVSLRMDYYKEFTNSEDTTLYREDVFGDIWANLNYSLPLKLKNTKVGLGARLILPTSKTSRAAGLYVNPGVTASVMQNIPIKGESADYLNNARVGLIGVYSHPFYESTTASPGSFGYTRQNVEGLSFVDPQLNGSLLTSNSLISILDTGLQITPKLSFTADMIFINQWKYQPTDDVSVTTGGAQHFIPRSSDSPRMTQNLWFSASLDYELLEELTLTLGYYNLANALGPDGERRGVWGSNNIWWSPASRVFFDVTANLDKIFDLVTGSSTHDVDPSERRRRITQNVQKTKLQHVTEANNNLQGGISF